MEWVKFIGNTLGEYGKNNRAFLNKKAALSLKEPLNSVCRHFGINEFKLKKGFQHHFKTSVIRFLTGLRMQHARQLLEIGQSSISDVCELLNYSHQNHFSIAFKKFFGITPSEVRRVKKVF